MTTDAPSVAANVRAELARRGLTQADLGEALGLRRTAINRRLTGEVAFDVDELRTTATFLGVTSTTLLGESEAMSA